MSPREQDEAPARVRLEAVLERLDALVDWERRDRTAAMRQELGPIRDLLARLGDPHLPWRAVHVGGTKGKGSVAALVAAGLARAGLRVGCYASPHVEHMTERVRIDGREVGAGALAASLERALDAREAARAEASPAAQATWFDLVTAAAFLVFAEEGIEWAVVEVGLGGRLDSTNAIAGEVCVLTGVDLEHTEVLGATRVAIASEKAGILEAGKTLVSGLPAEDEAGRVFVERAAELGMEVRFASGDTGSITERNLALAGAALDALGERKIIGASGNAVSRALLDEGTLRAARLPGRLERLDAGGVPVVLDGAHVPSSVELVLDELGADPRLSERPRVVLSLAADKDAAGVLKALAGRVDRVICTSVEGGRHRSAESLVALAGAQGLPAEPVPDPEGAVVRALERVPRGGWVLVVGSLYLAGALRERLLRRPTADPHNTPC